MQTFLEEVNERIGGVPIQSCYHCRKCTAGCPIAFAMEYNPDQIIKMIQMGMRDKVLNSSSIWLCASCETCVTRCPNEVDIARMMDVLREMAIESDVDVSVAVEIVKAAFNDNIDTIALASRDADYLPALQFAKERGKTVLVIGANPGFSKALQHVADHVEFLSKRV